ncbi:MAG: hypothetical protein IJ390_09995 [Lachnospiraceae bacterium]|nr:hypothetical protein [Lachnospiraceae bacterium]
MAQPSASNAAWTGGTKSAASKALLEMTLVFDMSLSQEKVRAAGADIISALKNADEIFRNVRCNVVWWHSDEKILHEVAAAPMIQMGRSFEGWEQNLQKKRLGILMDDLKKFQARARLLIVVTNETEVFEDAKLLHDSLNPFLYHRLILVTPSGLMTGRQLLAKCSGMLCSKND